MPRPGSLFGGRGGCSADSMGAVAGLCMHMKAMHMQAHGGEHRANPPGLGHQYQCQQECAHQSPLYWSHRLSSTGPGYPASLAKSPLPIAPCLLVPVTPLLLVHVTQLYWFHLCSHLLTPVTEIYWSQLLRYTIPC